MRNWWNKASRTASTLVWSSSSVDACTSIATGWLDIELDGEGSCRRFSTLPMPARGAIATSYGKTRSGVSPTSVAMIENLSGGTLEARCDDVDQADLPPTKSGAVDRVHAGQ